MSRFGLTLLVVICVVALAAFGRMWRARHTHRSARYSLQQLGMALEKRDRRAIEQYLDVRRVAESVVDEVIAATIAEGQSPEESGADQRPLLVAAMEAAFWMSFADPSDGTEGKVVPSLGVGSSELDYLPQLYQAVTEVEERGDVARAAVRFRLPQLDSATVAHLRMERADGYWRVIGVEGMAAALGAARARRLARGYEAEMQSDLRNLVHAQAMYLREHGTYASSLDALGYSTTAGVSIDILEASAAGWRAVARHAKAPGECRISVGASVRVGERAGQPQCTGH